jgi:tetratricopeptide (TPR) repeat protein
MKHASKSSKCHSLFFIVITMICSSDSTFSEILHEDGSSPSSEEYRQMIDGLYDEGLVQNAERIDRLCDSAIHAYPEDDYFYRLKLIICNLREDYAVGLAYGEKAYNLNPDGKNAANFARIITQLANNEGEASDPSYPNRLSRQYYEIGLQCFSIWLASEEDLLEATQTRGLLHYTFGEYRSALRDFNSAIEAFEAKHSSQPDNDSPIPLYYHRALTYQHLGNLNLAVDDLSSVLEMKTIPYVLRLRAQIYFGLYMYDKAIGDILEARRLSGLQTSDHEILGNCYKSLGEHGKALEEYQALVQTLSNDVDPCAKALAYMRLGALLVIVGRREEAYNSALQAREIAPEGSPEYEYAEMMLICLTPVPTVPVQDAEYRQNEVVDHSLEGLGIADLTNDANLEIIPE